VAWRYQPAAGCLADAAILELEGCAQRIQRVEQIAFDTEIAEGSEVWAHHVSSLEEGSKLTMQPRREIMISHVRRRVMARDEQAERVGELLDGVSDVFESCLPERMLTGAIHTPSTAKRHETSAHDRVDGGAAAIASASLRYAALSDPEIDSTGTPCMPA